MEYLAKRDRSKQELQRISKWIDDPGPNVTVADAEAAVTKLEQAFSQFQEDHEEVLATAETIDSEQHDDFEHARTH